LCVKDRSIDKLPKQLIGILAGSAAPYYRLEVNPAIWFLSALIFVQVIYTMAKRIRLEYILAWILPILGLIMSIYKDNSFLPLNIDVAFFLYPFWIVGITFKDKIDSLSNSDSKREKVAILTVSLLLLIVLYPLSQSGGINIYRLQYGNNIFLYYLKGIIGSVGMIGISICLQGFRFSYLFESLGKNTIVVLCYHQIFTFLTLHFVNAFAERVNTVAFFVLKYGAFCFMMGIMYILCLLINKYFPWIIGKRNIFKKG